MANRSTQQHQDNPHLPSQVNERSEVHEAPLKAQTAEDLIDYFPRMHFKDLNENQKINLIKDFNLLCGRTINNNGEIDTVGSSYVIEFRNNKQILFCFITHGTRQIPFSEFEFKFNLYIPSWRSTSSFNNDRRNNHKNAYDSYQQIFLKYTFTANHEQINRIHSTIEYKMNNSDHCYFARKPYPKPSPETIRKRKKYGKCGKNHRHSDDCNDLNDEMEGEQKYYKLPDLPSGKRKNASTEHDLFEYLHIIFNSAGLCIQDFIYDELKFPNDLKKVLQQKAQCQLDALHVATDKIYIKTINNPKKLLSKQFRTKYNTLFNQNRFSKNTRSTLTNSKRSRNVKSATSPMHSDYERPFIGQHRNRMDNITNINSLQNLDYRYHTVYIVSRPIEYNSALKTVGINHWALKFEGINHLMTIGFFYDDINKTSKINCNIIRNSKMNRRIFWYWYPRYNVNEYSPQFFNTNWKIIDAVYLGTMSTECIGRLINRWLTKYNIYVAATNNCQHFVRDMVSVMNIDVARKLPAFFDNKIITAIIPAAAAAGVMGEEARMLEVADMLTSEIEKYRNIIQERKEREMNEIIMHSDSENESDHEFIDKRSNSIDSIDWNICQQFIDNLSDNDNGNDNEYKIDNRIIYNEYKEIEEEEENEQHINDDINSDGNSESKDDEKQEMENITPQRDINVNINNNNNIMKGLSEKSKLIHKRNKEKEKVNDEYLNIMNMINQEMIERGINEEYINHNH